MSSAERLHKRFPGSVEIKQAILDEFPLISDMKANWLSFRNRKEYKLNFAHLADVIRDNESSALLLHPLFCTRVG